MDVHMQQLVRVAEFMSANAEVLRELMRERYFDDDATSLGGVANELERLRDIVEKIHCRGSGQQGASAAASMVEPLNGGQTSGAGR